jgi:hypothetical protein
LVQLHPISVSDISLSFILSGSGFDKSHREETIKKAVDIFHAAQDQAIDFVRSSELTDEVMMLSPSCALSLPLMA